MSLHANTFATWASIAVILVGGGMWVGSIASETTTNAGAVKDSVQQIDKLRDSVPADIAGLKQQVAALQRDIDAVKRSQDEILAELRKKR